MPSILVSDLEASLAAIQMTLQRAERDFMGAKTPQRKEEILSAALNRIAALAAPR